MDKIITPHPAHSFEQKTRYTIMPMKVDNKPSNNVSIMIGLLHVAMINEMEDGRYKVEVLWPDAFPGDSGIFNSRTAAISAVGTILYPINY